MIKKIKEKARQTKQFAQDHTTLVACGATALIVAKFTHDRNVKQFVEILYAKGHEYGELEAYSETLQLQRDVLLDFVNENQLDDDVRQFIKTLGQ